MGYLLGFMAFGALCFFIGRRSAKKKNEGSGSGGSGGGKGGHPTTLPE